MFFQKKKSKIDSKVRFQNRQFNQKLHQARTFKRTAKPVPEGSFDKFLARVGLGSRLAQAVVILLALGFLYIVYIPNFLTVQKIVVEGVATDQQQATASAIREALGTAPFYNPQRNLLFLDKARVESAALSVGSIDRVEKVSKNFGQKSLIVVVAPKRERFLVRDSERIFDVYNDGSLKGPAALEREAWQSVQNAGMVKIDVPGKLQFDFSGAKLVIIDTALANYLSDLQKELIGIPGSPLAYVSFGNRTAVKPVEEFTEELPEEAPAAAGTLVAEEPIIAEPIELEPAILDGAEVTVPLSAEELNLVLQKGPNSDGTFKVIIDPTEKARELVLRLNLLLSQTAPDRYNNLVYIDLRIKSRAFVCLGGAPCAN